MRLATIFGASMPEGLPMPEEQIRTLVTTMSGDRQLMGQLRHTVRSIQNCDLSDADDRIQEAFALLIVDLRGGTHIRNPHAWITTVTTRKALEQRRKDRRGPAFIPLSGLLHVWSEPEEIYGLQEILAVIEQHLPKAQRECLLLHVIGYETEQIAEVLLIQPASVTRNIERGRRRLREFRLHPEQFPITPRTQGGQA
ncbi:RNA polymerase sigma factor [Streptomyces sp. NRRL S-244]|uniref:RNA polymerase sigma factor n=1 Tax=Streptomyces sp. NRRL S-244 TaxID=1463897 RepID=UPI0004C25B7A|nr:RNA polymerase sigma factor [Streptomyces sp. NRRL S-244]